MSIAAIPFIMQVYQGLPKSVSAVYDLLNGRLTAARAGLLDYLGNLAGGPAALQAVEGTRLDPAQANPASATQTMFALLWYMENQLVDIDSIVHRLLAAPPTNVVFTPQQSNVNPQTTFIPCAGGPGGLQTVSFAQAAVYQFNQTANGACVNSNAVFSPSAPSYGQVPLPNGFNFNGTIFSTTRPKVPLSREAAAEILQVPVESLPAGEALEPTIVAGSGAFSGSLVVAANGTTPTLTSDGFLWQLGGDSGGYVGIWRVGGQYYPACSPDGSSQNLGPAFGTSIPYPVTIQWSATQCQFLTGASQTFFCAFTPSQMPDPTRYYPLHLSYGNSLYAVRVGYTN
jgi:hypothetical protein